jgi:hypothetical protein
MNYTHHSYDVKCTINYKPMYHKDYITDNESDLDIFMNAFVDEYRHLYVGTRYFELIFPFPIWDELIYYELCNIITDTFLMEVTYHE